MRANTARADERGKHGIVSWLQIELQERRDTTIFVSEQSVINCLIHRELECKTAFSELINGLECFQWQAYLSVIISTAAIWNPEETNKLREIDKELCKLNESIASNAQQLAADLRNRTNLCNDYGFDTDTTYHILELIDYASAGNGHYQSWIRDKIQPLRGQFDLKYWPSVDEIVDAISDDALKSAVTPTSEITREAISSRKSSTRDFLRALSEALRQNSESYHAFIPDDFRLSGRSISTLVNCVLNLNENRCIDESYIKSTRHKACKDFRL